MSALADLSNDELLKLYMREKAESKEQSAAFRGLSDDQLKAAYAKAKERESKIERSDAFGGASQVALDALGSIARGAGSIGATLLTPIDMAKDALDGKGLSLESNRKRRADMDSALDNLGVDRDSTTYQVGKVGTEIAGTLGVGGAMAAPVKALSNLSARAGAGSIPALDTAATALASGGFRTGAQMGRAADLATRVGAGAVTGGAAAGLVNPEDAGMGALIGGALPGAMRVGAEASRMVGQGVRNLGGKASPEVAALAKRAEELGINIPADRLVDSRPLNAAAESLNYIPLSGRKATEDAMNSQLNQALSRTFGQDTSNVTQALRAAGPKLGGQFDDFLQSNTVRVDEQFMDDLAEAANQAYHELSGDGASIITKQVDDIIAKAASGEIDGQAAYNIKKTLDRIGNRNSPEAWYALDLKGKLMDALNRSVGDEAAAGFADLRKQYSNMLSLQKLAKNGVEGELSVARIANLPNIRNAELQELADIAAQFVKSREAKHGAAQRVYGAGGTVAAAGMAALGVPGAAAAALAAGGVMGAGRMTNAALNSQGLKDSILGVARESVEPAAQGMLTGAAAKALPVLGAGALASPAMAEEKPNPIAAIGQAETIDQAIAAASQAVAEPVKAQPQAVAAPVAAPAPAPAPVVAPEPLAAPEPAANLTPAQQSGDEPARFWTGRRGDGYAGEGDAQMAMRTRQKVEPQYDWKIENRAGRFVLAGYAKPEQPQGLMNASGTAVINDPTGDVRKMFAERGISSLPMSGGRIMVSTRQAQEAMRMLGGGQ